MKKPPDLLANIYRDMRDRRLLPLAALLLAAIVAVPVILKSQPNAPVTAKIASSSATAAAPRGGAAVTVSDHGVRRAGSRLSGRGPNNPFDQKFQGAGASGSQVKAVGSGAASAPPSSGSSTASSGSGGGTTSPTQLVLVDYKVDVRTGEAGSKLANRDGVKELTYLPGVSKPVFVFMGVSASGKNAFFLLPGGLPLTGGSCLVPIGGNCSIATMRVGQTIDVVWTDLKTYRLKLDAIHPIVRKVG